jgi:hypothetical protein
MQEPAATATQQASPTAAQQTEPTATTAAETPTSQAAPAAQGTVAPDDPAIQAGDMQFPGEGAAILGYLARPAGDDPRPVILVCHENRGLTEHIKDVARRLAKAGYVALAVDLLSRQGGVAAFSSDQVPGALGNTPPEQFVQDFRSGWEYLKANLAQAERWVWLFYFKWQRDLATPSTSRTSEWCPLRPHPRREDAQISGCGDLRGNDQRINQASRLSKKLQKNSQTYEKASARTSTMPFTTQAPCRAEGCLAASND